MKDFHDDRQDFAALLPRTEWGERSCIGVSLLTTCEGDKIKIYPCLYGRACTWQDLVVALLWCPEGEYSLGETLETMGGKRTTSAKPHGGWNAVHVGAVRNTLSEKRILSRKGSGWPGG